MKINLSGLTLLTIFFIGLKLTNHIDWSWWWVLSPTLIQVGLGLFFIVIIFLCGLLGAVVRARK
jgi:ABC-type antimicrobial peptide transport system permease subunit